ncbi:MAG: invasion associated locus B family protein [Magnetococcales bacterium]|nr:invasion associated locus B family protein [Magnetococcales bacterium]
MKRIAMWMALGLIFTLSAEGWAGSKKDKDKDKETTEKATSSESSEKGKAFDDWTMKCGRPEENGPELCLLAHAVFRKDAKEPSLIVRLNYQQSTKITLLSAIVPLGVDLAAGVSLKADDGFPTNLALRYCTPAGCEAFLPLDGSTLKAISGAKKIVIGWLPVGAKEPLIVPVSTKGLKAGLEALQKS